jgi:hypothetical protein
MTFGAGTFHTSYSLAITNGKGLAVGDVDHDPRPDVYVETFGSNPNPPDPMLRNQGGTTFVQTSIPETTAGSGAWVSSIDYDGDGGADFVVSNGAKNTAGPIQLIGFP